MSESEPGPEEDKGFSTVEPPSAYVRGRRPVTVRALPARKLSTHVSGHNDEPPKPELDEFGLPVRRQSISSRRNSAAETAAEEDGKPVKETATGEQSLFRRRSRSAQSDSRSASVVIAREENSDPEKKGQDEEPVRGPLASFRRRSRSTRHSGRPRSMGEENRASSNPPTSQKLEPVKDKAEDAPQPSEGRQRSRTNTLNKIPEHTSVVAAGGVSEWSHQALAPREVEVQEEKEDEWQDMPAYGKYNIYDDEGRLVARGTEDSDNEADVYDGLGGAGKGYTRVQIDDDAKSATSMDENTSYLFREKGTNVVDEDEDQRDPLAQMQATKDMLTEGQRIAYVGVTRLAMAEMVKNLEDLQGAKAHKKELGHAIESMKMWSQKMMVRLYGHMEIDSSGQSEPCWIKAVY